MTTNYYKKTKNSFQKILGKGNQNISKEKKTKSINMLVSDIEIFLKKKKKRVNMVVNERRVFWKMSIKNFFLECKK